MKKMSHCTIANFYSTTAYLEENLALHKKMTDKEDLLYNPIYA